MATFSNSTNRRAITVQEQERNSTTYEAVQNPVWYLRQELGGTPQDLGSASITVDLSASATLDQTVFLPMEASPTVDLSASATLSEYLGMGASTTVDLSASGTMNLVVYQPMDASVTVDLNFINTELTADEYSVTTYSGNVGNDMAINLTLSAIMDIEVPPADPESQFELIKLRGFKMNTPVIGSDGKPT